MSDRSSDPEQPGSSWVTFDEEKLSDEPIKAGPAVLDTQTVQVVPNNLGNSQSRTPSRNEKENIEQPKPEQRKNVTEHPVSQLNVATLQNVPLNDVSGSQSDTYPQPVIRQGFANGDVIVTILPQNRTFPWITPAQFRPELVPEELMAQGLTLTVEDYVQIMSQLVNDHRFTIYNMCYKRILMLWITVAFMILLGILFAGFHHLAMFGAGIAWLLFNAAAIFFCMWIKIRLNKNLEQCLSKINLQLMKHNIILGVDDRGKLSCHKVHLCFIYFDSKDCLAKLQQLIDQKQLGPIDSENTANGNNDNFLQNLDIEDPEIIITGTTNTRVNKQQAKSSLLFGRYCQRWAKEYLRKRLHWAFDASSRLAGLSPPRSPRHLNIALCPCQFIEEHLAAKAHRQKSFSCCACLIDFCQAFD